MRNAFTLLLAALTAGLAYVRYDALGAPAGADRLSRALGYAAAPWIVGLIVAGVALAIARSRHRPAHVRTVVESVALVVLLVLFAVTLFGRGP